MIKTIKDLDITASGVSVFNRKWQPIHLQQGEMDGACAVYSMMMNLLILKVLTRNQVVNLKTTFKGNTAKGRLFKEFFVTEGLCRDGFYFSEIKDAIIFGSYSRDTILPRRGYIFASSIYSIFIRPNFFCRRT